MAKFITPLRYPGGKSRVAKEIVGYFPSFSTYREPFIGGGSVFLETKSTMPEKTYWINDLNQNLISFWAKTKNDLDNLVNEITSLKIQFTNDGRGLYKHLRNGYAPDDDMLKIATRFFILNRITFSGLTDSGGYSEESFKKRFTDSSLEKLLFSSKLLQEVKITNLDYSSLLSEVGQDVFIFLDPPYFSQKNSKLYGENGDLHTQFKHDAFAEEVLNCKHKWMITYDDSPYIRDLFQGHYIYDWDIQYGMGSKRGSLKKGKELIITNYKIDNFRNEKISS